MPRSTKRALASRQSALNSALMKRWRTGGEDLDWEIPDSGPSEGKLSSDSDPEEEIAVSEPEDPETETETEEETETGVALGLAEPGDRPRHLGFGDRLFEETMEEYEARTADRCEIGKRCCALRILESQTDFQGEKSMLENIIIEAGHEVIFYPKFHCELNYIEYY